MKASEIIPDSAARAKPGTRGNYYTPAARIDLDTGVEHNPRGINKQGWRAIRCDLYVGTAEALERCGLLRHDMLPPGYSITWRPRGDEPQGGENWYHVPGYIEIIKRPTAGLYHLYRTVSRQEQEARVAAQRVDEENARILWRQREAEQMRQREAEQISHPPPKAGKAHLRLVWSAS
jgi:hypothetical protein